MAHDSLATPRGTVSIREAGVGEPNLGDRPGLVAYSEGIMKHPPVILDGRMRVAVEEAIQERCTYKVWPMHALNVRTNHVHVVLTAEDESHQGVLQQLKAWATRRLRSEALVPPSASVWARHGSTISIWDEEGLAEVVDYVLFRQGVPLT